MFMFYGKLSNLFSEYYDDTLSGYDKWHMSNLEYRYVKWMAKNVWPIFLITLAVVPVSIPVAFFLNIIWTKL